MLNAATREEFDGFNGLQRGAGFGRVKVERGNTTGEGRGVIRIHSVYKMSLARRGRGAKDEAEGLGTGNSVRWALGPPCSFSSS